MNINEIIETLKVKRNHLLRINDLADKGPGLYSSEIIKQNPNLFAKEFAEGDKHLEAFLLECFIHDVETRACCAGHRRLLARKEKSYVTFDNILKDEEKIRAMINSIYPTSGVEIEFGTLLNSYCDEYETRESITFRFDKRKNAFFYGQLARTIDSTDKHKNALPIEINYLHNICFANNMSMIPDAAIGINNDNEYVIRFYNALSYLRKKQNEGIYTNIFNILEYEERTGFNKLLSDLGFSRNAFSWIFTTSDYNQVINKLTGIYNWSNSKETSKNISVDEMVFLIRDVAAYYGACYNASTESHLSYNDNSLLLTVHIFDEQDGKKMIAYSKKLPYDECVELSLCSALIKDVVSEDENALVTSDNNYLSLKYGCNSLLLRTPNLNNLYTDEGYGRIKTIK